MTDREYAKMCVGYGWRDLVDEAFDLIEKEEGVTVAQVKEKFGGLRIYTDGASEFLQEKLFEIENQSYHTCEDCGVPAESKRLGGWIRTICDSCERIRRVLAKA